MLARKYATRNKYRRYEMQMCSIAQCENVVEKALDKVEPET